jgi:hypothetical protein
VWEHLKGVDRQLDEQNGTKEFLPLAIDRRERANPEGASSVFGPSLKSSMHQWDQK